MRFHSPSVPFLPPLCFISDPSPQGVERAVYGVLSNDPVFTAAVQARDTLRAAASAAQLVQVGMQIE